MEFFANYGEMWDANADRAAADADIFQDKLTRSDYALADKILDRILLFMDKFGDQMSGGGDLQDDVLDFMLEMVLEDTVQLVCALKLFVRSFQRIHAN
jgi:hypothetical protein